MEMSRDGTTVYENIIIGNFMYALGFAVKAKSPADTELSAVSVSLLQQTPLDRAIGDVLLDTPGAVRIIEFKDANNDSDKEPFKRLLLKAGIAEEGKHELLESMSRAIHWMVITTSENETLVSAVEPYLEPTGLGERRLTFEDFIDLTATDIATDREHFDAADLRFYLNVLAGSQGPEDRKLSRRALVFVGAPSGLVKYAVVSDLRQLRMQHREYVNSIKVALGQALAIKAAELNQSRRQSIDGTENEIDRSHSIGFSR